MQPARKVADPVVEELLSADGLLRTVLDNTNDGFVLVDPAGRIRWASPSLHDLLGYVPELWVGHHVLEFVHHDDLEAALPSLLRVTSGTTTAEPVVVRARHADGEWRWVEALTKRIHGGPASQGAMFTLRDVTHRVETEQALHTSEARLATYLANSKDLTALVDDEGRIRWVSGNVEEMLGYQAAELVGTPAFDLVDPDDVDEALRRFTRIAERTDVPSPLVLQVRRKDGTMLTVEGLGSVLSPETGESGILVNVRDARARIEAEEALRASEARFRTVVQHSYDVVAVIDGEGVIKWVTPNSVQLLGWEPDEVVGTNGFNLVHPEDLGLMLDELAAFSTHTGVPNPTTIKMLHKDGTWHHVELVGTDMLDNPDIAGITLNLRGVDERVAAERDRHRLTDIFELTSDLVGIIDADGSVVYLNDAAQHFFGVDDTGTTDATQLAHAFTEASLGRISVEALPALEQGRLWSGELELVRADGIVVPVLAQMILHRDADGTAFRSGIFRDISERKAFESRLEHQATHDPLTGLPNRTLLLDRLEHALARASRRGRGVGVLFCDLDHFKFVYDSLGHSAGDRLLVEVARRLEAELRPGDTVSRFGGDEYIVLCEDLDDPADAVAVAERVDAALEASFDLDGDEVHIGVSVGIAVADSGGSDAEALIRDADAAMYRAKASGRRRHQLFEADMWEAAVDRFDVEHALRRATERGELELMYQPIIDLRDGAVCSVEALVRWNHPVRGRLLPHEFIAVAEETGTIVPMGAWVLAEACAQLRAWQLAMPGLVLSIAVNLSGRQLAQPDLVDEVDAALGRSGIDPGLLALEITESVLMDDVEHSQRTLEQLNALGVQLSVDDFGTGYSSLSYLKRFPVDQLKVDRSFVDGLGAEPEDTAIVAAIVNLAHTLGMEATAEGVETLEQRRQLEELGCDRAQGFLLAEPCSADEVAALLTT